MKAPTTWLPLAGSFGSHLAETAFGSVERFTETEDRDAWERIAPAKATHYRELPAFEGYDFRLDNGEEIRVRGDWDVQGFCVHGVEFLREGAPV